MGDEFDEFDDIDDAALLQAIDTSSNAGVSKPATTGSGSCVARTHPLVQQFGNPVAPSRPTAPPGVSRPTLGGNTQFGGQRRSVGAPMTVQQATTVQKSSRGGSHQTTGSFPKTPSGYNKTGSQNAGGISKSTHSPGFGSSPYGSSAQAATPSSSANRSMTMYHGIPQPGSNGLMRQTTLMGGLGEAEASFTASGRQYRGDINEPPTHHELDLEACKTWQYPMNLGNIREYQYTIVQSCLFANTLVALPTGLGKTLIAATVMLNFYRWTKTAKLVFIAPTRPLVSQQVSACYDIAGIPKSDTTILMGTVKPAIRAQEWAERRVIFTTPQTLENDISRGYADPKQIALLVVDEAHRATGNYSAAKACRKIMNFNSSFRVMALTATPGSNVQSVQDVINNLGISKVEIRTEESIDLRQYTHARQVDTRIVDYSDELATVRERFTKALQPITSKLTEFNVFWGRDAMSIAAFTINNAKREWMQTSGRDANQGVKGVVLALFDILLTVAHPIKLLNYHGIIPFYNDITPLP